MESPLILILSSGLTGFVTGFITWFFARRKNAAEAQGKELDNVDKAIRIYKDVFEAVLVQLNERITKQNLIIEKQQGEIEALKCEIKELKQKQIQ